MFRGFQRVIYGLFLLFYHTAIAILAICWKLRSIWLARRQCRGPQNRLLKPCSSEDLQAFTALSGPAIWVHAASLGEVKAATILISRLMEQFPRAKWVLSTLTDTGLKELKGRFSGNTRILSVYLPIDLPFLLRPLIDPIAPKVCVMVEGDVWFNFLRLTRSKGAKIAVVSAKISLRSWRRLRWVKGFLNAYWSRIDAIGVQSTEHLQRLLALGAKNTQLTVTGNFKLDQLPPRRDERSLQGLRERFGLVAEDRVLVIASTHAGEEVALVQALDPLLKSHHSLHVIIAPRHPERCEDLLDPLSAWGPISRWSQPNSRLHEHPQVHLMDVIGHLNECYLIAELAIVGGSFVAGFGGHNIFEPILAGTPPLFGPHMSHQRELVQLALKTGAGIQVSLQSLLEVAEGLIIDHQARARLIANCAKATQIAGGSIDQTLHALEAAGVFRALV